MKKSLLVEALRLSRKALPKHPEYSCYPHFTFLVQDNQIVEMGLNRRHEPPRKLGYHNHKDKTFRPKWHSELDALHKYRLAPGSFEIINVRLNKAGETRLAVPCSTCRNILDVLRCGRAYFTTESGWGVLLSR